MVPTKNVTTTCQKDCSQALSLSPPCAYLGMCVILSKLDQLERHHQNVYLFVFEHLPEQLSEANFCAEFQQNKKLFSGFTSIFYTVNGNK